MSITQYLENDTELDNIINNLRLYIKKTGKLIIADVIDSNTSAIRDAISLLLQCTKKGRPLVFVKFITYLMFSEYRKLSKSVKLLKLSEQSIRQIAEKNGLDCQKVNGLTLHRSRTNYILTPKGN